MIIWNKFKISLIVRNRKFICMEKYDIFINKVQNLLEEVGIPMGKLEPFTGVTVTGQILKEGYTLNWRNQELIIGQK